MGRPRRSGLNDLVRSSLEKKTCVCACVCVCVCVFLCVLGCLLACVCMQVIDLVAQNQHWLPGLIVGHTPYQQAMPNPVIPNTLGSKHLLPPFSRGFIFYKCHSMWGPANNGMLKRAFQQFGKQ